MSFPDLVYDAGVQIARPLLTVAAPLSPKLRAGVHGRRGASDRLVDWAHGARDAARPLVWLHAPSVGESLMGQAIIRELRSRLAGVQIVFTHFSPSAERIAQRVGADVADYLPWDTHAAMTQTLSALRPTAIAFVRTEIWPALVRAADTLGVRTALVNAALSVNSSRLRGSSKWLLGPSYQRLYMIGAIAVGDAERFAKLGVTAERVRVTGDARFDQVHARVQQLDREQPLLERLRDERATTIVAGSTWPTDEAELIPAFATARKGSALRLIIAPHEPDHAHLRGLEQRLDAARVRHARLSAVEASESALPEAVVVDRIGVLADLYAIATVAYVGGGFHGAGLHSVIEPAALGVPVIFGPRHGNAREADELTGNGGGFVASDGQAFASLVLDLAERPMHRRTSSEAARAFVAAKLGGARRNAELIVEMMR
ncbi:MAG: 3-deoxy-D-manno-octulosonic acid transferase [Gemmatimonadota bacterium]